MTRESRGFRLPFTAARNPKNQNEGERHVRLTHQPRPLRFAREVGYPSRVLDDRPGLHLPPRETQGNHADRVARGRPIRATPKHAAADSLRHADAEAVDRGAIAGGRALLRSAPNHLVGRMAPGEFLWIRWKC